MFLKNVGFVASVFLRVGRAGGGPTIRKLNAVAFHVFRSVAHKIASVQIALIALLGYCCAHPKLQDMLFKTCSVSLLGNAGRLVFIDRLVENINFLQQKRMNAFTGFEKALHHTDLLKPMLHVDHAFEEAESSTHRSDDHFSKSMVFEARKLQNMFVRLLGTDLTVDDNSNPFWHTGIPTDIDSGDYRERRPWEWIWRTASGSSKGKGRAKAEKWSDYVLEFFRKNTFGF